MGRDWRLLVGGLPAVVFGGVSLVLIILACTTSHEELKLRYLDRARSAFQSSDYATALTCYDRLVPTAKEHPEILFGLAQTALAAGQPGRAVVILKALAPPDQQGYPPAHMWMARRLMQLPSTTATRKAARDHLRHALEGDLDSADAAYGLLGQLYLADKDYTQAEAYLARAVKTHPELRLKRAELHVLLGNQREARNEAQLAIDYFQSRARADAADHQARLTWADGVTFLEQFPEAVAILKGGLDAKPEPAARDAYHAALGRVHAAWLESLDREKRGTFGEKLKLLDQGLQYDPTNLALLDRLIAAVRIQGARADEARTTLRGLLARGEGSATIHFALGADAWQQHDRQGALVHLEEAYRLAPQMPLIANNLAWLLAQGPPDSLPRALELSNLVVERAPDEPAFRGTRGEIRARMGKWKEALADLETALTKSPKNVRLHQTLADVYTHLGVPAMAAEHQRLAREHQGAALTDPGKIQ
jgi:tetratricopeptide (TPR) repeat protein